MSRAWPTATTVEEAVAHLNSFENDPYPLTVVPAWTLGSVGRMNVVRRRDFESAVQTCLEVSPTTEVALIFPIYAASAIEARQRTDPEEGLDPEGESAATEGGDAQEGAVRDHE